MSHPDAPSSGRSTRRHRWLIPAVVAVALAAIGVLALLALPYGSATHEIQLTPGQSVTTEISVPHPGWVTVHFDHPYAMGPRMSYWMQGGGSGMMFDHSMMGGSDSYSFWSWGGTYECGAGYYGTGPGMMPVWINATWGVR